MKTLNLGNIIVYIKLAYAYPVIMTPKYVRWRLRAVCYNTCQVHCTTFLKVDIRTTKNCGFWLCESFKENDNKSY